MKSMEKRIGYKAFYLQDGSLINLYGKVFMPGVVYKASKKIGYGVGQYGYHFASTPEDCLRYFDTYNKDVVVTMADIMGEAIIRNDEYNGYLELGSTDKIMISKVFSRDALISHFANNAVPFYRVERFVRDFKMTPDEFSMIYQCHQKTSLDKVYDYYQNGNKDAFSVSSLSKDKVYKL